LNGGGLGWGVRRPLEPETVDMRGPKPEGRFLNSVAEAGRSHEPLSHGAGGGRGGAEGLR